MDSVRSLVGDDLAAVDDEIRHQLHSDVVLIDQVANYIIGSGGKRLRPALVIVASRACGYTGSDHIKAAAIIEFIHTATLLHDDVVDASALRRGQETANTVWGNEASVLVGDFLYSRAFQMMVEIDRMRVMQILANATNTIAEGEVMQLVNCHDPDTTEDAYLKVIHRKTAKLFEAGVQIAAVLADQPAALEEQLSRYGRHLGTAFQLIDDVLDYSASPEELGKNIGDDLAEGKPTLPLIHAMRRGTPEQVNLMRKAIEAGGLDHINEVMGVIESTEALQYTAQLARREAEAALEAIQAVPDSDYKDALSALARLSVDRSY
ncbi:MAG: octaprenyl diphosphate synthase [Gammaproteobacteria bacterium]|nr:octaprenyl diphosphate synthase [Gammaproteobacteria bacterium]NNM20301.1 octaprenyl diphosphate synthase [Gammaproteobacteria bacterium]